MATQQTHEHHNRSSHLHGSSGGSRSWHCATDSACQKSTATETTTIRNIAPASTHAKSITDHTHTSGHTPCGAPDGAPNVSAARQTARRLCLHRVVCAPSWRAGLPPRTLARPFASLKHPRFARLGRLSPAIPRSASPPPPAGRPSIAWLRSAGVGGRALSACGRKEGRAPPTPASLRDVVLVASEFWYSVLGGLVGSRRAAIVRLRRKGWPLLPLPWLFKIDCAIPSKSPKTCTPYTPQEHPANGGRCLPPAETRIPKAQITSTAQSPTPRRSGRASPFALLLG